MQLPEPPKITAVEVVAAQPTEADRAAIAHMGVKEPGAVYVVKVRLKAKPQVTSMAWALYVDDELVSKYWEYADGIYFTVFDPQFFIRHEGKQLRFSQNGIDFFDTGVALAAAPSVAEGNAIKLPLQADVLKHRLSRPRASGASAAGRR
jgi:hypothetical protein